MNRAGKPEQRRLPAAVLALAALLAWAGLATLASAAENATVARDTELRAKPLNDAPVIAPLKAKATVSIIARSGAWAQVNAGGKTGHVRLLNLRTSSGQKGDSGAGSVASVFRTGSSGSSVSTGVKGLNEADLKNAKADPEQLKKLATFATGREDATASAKTAGLAATRVEWLPEPDGKKKKKKKSED